MERLSDLSALRLDECVAHTAADDEVVHLVEKVLYDTELGTYLRATDDGCERMLCVFQHVVDGCHFLLHQITQHLGVCVEVVGYHGC